MARQIGVAFIQTFKYTLWGVEHRGCSAQDHIVAQLCEPFAYSLVLVFARYKSVKLRLLTAVSFVVILVNIATFSYK